MDFTIDRMGNNDRVMRVLIGVVMITNVFIGLTTVWGWLGIIPIVTGLFSFCPLYTILGISTK